MRFFIALLSTVLKASLALRGAFLLQVSLMVVNNVLYFASWWILLQRFDHIRGYRLPDMLALFGVSTCVFGLVVVAFGGVLDLAQTITEGNLDALLSQPKNVLLRAIATRSRASGWGDIASGSAMLVLSGYVHLANVPIVLMAVLSGALVLLSSAVLINSAAFWLSEIESISLHAFNFLLALALYPPTLFGGATKVLLFTVLPAGLVAYLPVELVRDFHAGTALLAVAAALVYAGVAWFVFQRGLRHYASGSRFTVWG